MSLQCGVDLLKYQGPSPYSHFGVPRFFLFLQIYFTLSFILYKISKRRSLVYRGNDFLIRYLKIMAAPSRFANGSATRPSSPSDPTWATDLRNRLSNTAIFQRQTRAEHADSSITPLSLSTPQLRPIPPPNSPIAIRDRHTSHPPRHNRTFRSLKSSRQASLSRQITVNKIKVHVTIEVITEDCDKTHQSPEFHAEISTSPRSSKRRPRLQIRYARSPSPVPVKPCPIAHVARRSVQDEDCSICSTSLALEPVENLVWCKGACGNNFHKSCFDVWREYAARPVRCVHWYVMSFPPIRLYEVVFTKYMMRMDR
jgi:hypothetical protein